MNGTFTSVWDFAIINTPAELDEETGEVFTPSVDVTGDNGSLIEEFFMGEDGEQREICPTCHTFILKTEMVERIGKTLIERTGCTDEHCDNFIENY
jgi:hypothetical protein